ncbi:MAG TPA: PAS domain S-box protein, partial [Rubricoccaceae bacterium]
MTTARPAFPSTLLARPKRRPLRVLHLEDSPADGAVVRRYLDRQGFGAQVVCVYTREDFLEQLDHDFDVVLADHSMPGFDSCEALRLVRDRCPQVPFIIVSGTITEDAAVESIKSGAADYIWKDRLQRLGPAIENALREQRHRTEKEAALRARRESEALSHAVLASLSQLICVLGPDGVIVKTNAAWQSAGAARGLEGLAGLDVGTDYLDVCSRAAGRGAATAAAALAGITAVLSGAQTEFSMEYPCHSPTDRAWYTLCVTPLGGGLGAVLSHQSITDLRDSQERLSQNQMRLKAIFEGSLDAIVLADDEGRYVDANPAAAALLGYSREEFLEIGVPDVLSVSQDLDFSERWAAIQSNGTDSRELVLYRKDGTAVNVEQRATFNVLPGLHLSTFRDITARKAAEATLRKSEERLRLVSHATNDAVWDWDMRTDRFVTNPAFGEIFGWREQAAAGF